MIYLYEGKVTLNDCYEAEIEQEANGLYQLTFKFPTKDDKHLKLVTETELIADDLSGEQYFTIFEVVKHLGYVTVYANQVMTALNHYTSRGIGVDRVQGNVVMTALAGSLKRSNPFAFSSDITDKHTLNLSEGSAMDVLLKGKHSIMGQWGGDLVRDRYQVKLLKNGGAEKESLFMYKKNLRSYEETTSIKDLRTRIHFRKKLEAGEGDEKKVTWLRVSMDSPLINSYKKIYEADLEVTDQDVTNEESLRRYAKDYFKKTLCDLPENRLELDVVGNGDERLAIFDVVTVFHEGFGVDLRKKITQYRYNPMSKRLKSIGFGATSESLGTALSSLVEEKVQTETDYLESSLEQKLENANRVFDAKQEELTRELLDGIERDKAEAERKAAIFEEELRGAFQTFDTSAREEVAETKRKVEEALRIANSNLDLTLEASSIGKLARAGLSDLRKELEGVKTDTVTRSSLSESLSGINRRFEEVKSETTSIASYTQGVNGRLTTIASQLNQKADASDFQRVRETSQLYERIIGSNAGEVAEKISRMVVTNSLFSVEVKKNIGVGGVNLFKGTKDFTDAFTYNPNSKSFADFKYQGFSVNSQSHLWGGIGQLIEVQAGETYTFSAYLASSRNEDSVYYFCHLNDFYPQVKAVVNNATAQVKAHQYWTRFSVTFTVEKSGWIAPCFERSDQNATLYVAGFQLERGNVLTDWKPNPEDIDERVTAVATRQEQLAGSWAVQHLNQAGDVVAQINLLGRNAQIQAETIRLEGTTLADKIRAYEGNFSTLLVRDGYFYKLNSDIIKSNSITADKLIMDQGFANKFVANQAAISTLFAKQIIAPYVQAVDLTAEQIKSGVVRSLNGAMTIDLNNANMTFHKNAGIRLEGNTNAIYRQKRTHTGFLHFADITSALDGGVGSVYAALGVTSSGDGINSWSSGRFAGIRCFRGARGTEHIATVDKVEIIGDKVEIIHTQNGGGFIFEPTRLASTEKINVLDMLKGLATMWVHFGNGMSPEKVSKRTDSSVNNTLRAIGVIK